jgi:hypothetical protein
VVEAGAASVDLKLRRRGAEGSGGRWGRGKGMRARRRSHGGRGGRGRDHRER